MTQRTFMKLCLAHASHATFMLERAQSPREHKRWLRIATHWIDLTKQLQQ